LVMAVQNPPVKGGFEPPVMSFSAVVKCFRRFRCMLQLFYMYVAKVDQGCCTYCKCFRGIL
jgi:hypothetical protein